VPLHIVQGTQSAIRNQRREISPAIEPSPKLPSRKTANPGASLGDEAKMSGPLALGKDATREWGGSSIVPLIRSIALVLLVVVILALDIHAETKRLYESEIVLPMDLYAHEGTLLQAGRFKLELRLEEGRHSLVFLRQEKVVATLFEQPSQATRPSTGESQVPLFGTLHLLPVGAWDENTRFKPGASDYFPKLPWRAMLRAYRSEDPADTAVKLVVSEKDSAEKLFNKNFKLYLKKPN